MKIKDVLPKAGVFDSKVKKALLASPKTLVELANRFAVPPKEIEKAIQRLQASGHRVVLKTEDHTLEIEKIMPEGSRISVDSHDFFDGKWYTFGALGDTHCYSKYARMDVLNCLYDIYQEEGIKNVFHQGNILDGEFRYNRYDLVGPSGLQHQLDYVASEYPQRKGIRTRFVTGDDHEGWYINREGVNIGALIQQTAEKAGRKDLEWIGHIEADVEFKAKKGKSWLRSMHAGGGTAYAVSYTTQKIVESLQGGEKPAILLVGHYHKFEYGYPREVHVVQTATTQDQTPFLRKMKIQAHVGGTIIRFHQAQTGEINRLMVEWIPYYDKRFYGRLDKYRRW